MRKLEWENSFPPQETQPQTPLQTNCLKKVNKDHSPYWFTVRSIQFTETFDYYTPPSLPLFPPNSVGPINCLILNLGGNFESLLNKMAPNAQQRQ